MKSSFKKFLFDWARDNATLSIHDKEIDQNVWAGLLDTLLSYHGMLEETAHKYKLTFEQCHDLILFLKSNAMEGI